MKPTEKEKICISCEGRIPLEAQTCTYCTAEQYPAKTTFSAQGKIFHTQSLEDSLASLYTPPYQGKRPQFIKLQTSEIKEPQKPFYEEPTMYGSKIKLEEGENKKEGRGAIFPILLLFAGIQLMLLGLTQLFFSKGGLLTLQWNAEYWFFYCLLAAFLLYFGYQKLKNIS